MPYWRNPAFRLTWRAANEAARLRGRGQIRGLLEQPGRQEAFSHWVLVHGWAVALDGDPLVVKVRVSGRLVQEIEMTEQRPNVIEKDPQLAGHSPLCGFDAIVPLEDRRLPRFSLLTVTAVSRKRPSVRRTLGVAVLEQRRAGAREVPRHAYQETWDAASKSLSDARYSVAGTADEQDLDQSGESTATDVQRETGLTPSDRVLEIGCGVGRVGVKLAARCREWVGSDVSENMLRHARETLAKANIQNVRFEHLNGIDLSGIPEASFDVVYCTTVFMHLEEWDRYRYVCEAYRVLKPGGRVYYDNVSVTTPDGWRLFEQTSRMDPAARPPNISKSSTPEELRTYATKAGFLDIKVRPGALFVTVTAKKGGGGVAESQAATEMTAAGA